MEQNILTIVTSVEADNVEALRTCLREFNPTYLTSTNRTTCHPKLPLCDVQNLHFASLLIIDAFEDLDACLVFEATFDGSREAFLQQFVATCSEGIDTIYVHCRDFPGQTSSTPHLTVSYLDAHDVAASAYYAGSSGRTVSQVTGESRLRNAIVSFLNQYRRNPGTVPGTYSGIQRDIQNKVVRNEHAEEGSQKQPATIAGQSAATVRSSDLSWAEETFTPPFRIRHGRKLSVLAFGLLWALAALLSAVILDLAFSLSPHDLAGHVTDWERHLASASSTVKAYVGPILERLIVFINDLAEPVALTILLLAAAWLALRIADAVLRSMEPDPERAPRLFRWAFTAGRLARRTSVGALIVVVVASWLVQPIHESIRSLLIVAGIWLTFRVLELGTARLWPAPSDAGFGKRLFRHLLVLGRHITFFALVGLAILVILDMSEESEPQPIDIASMQALENWVVNTWKSSEIPPLLTDIYKALKDNMLGKWLLASVPFLVALIAILRLRYWKTSLQMMTEFKHLPYLQDSWRRTRIDIANIVILALVWFLVAYLLHVLWRVGVIEISPSEQMAIAATLSSVVTYILVAGVYALIVIAAVYAAGLIVLLAVRASEFIDRRRYETAEILIERPRANLTSISREEHGINSYQNHLASLTILKRGTWRLALLKATLLAVNLLARWWHNRGDLSGIPTILFARWVLLDRGRRLLFLTNYGGAWESYLNEFIDMGAVKGVNAIWTNTAIKSDGDKLVGFPETSFMFFGGAQIAHAFKAYVRRSQVETLVWYSAYPHLSITNIINNGAVRDGLFRQLKAEELDALSRRL